MTTRLRSAPADDRWNADDAPACRQTGIWRFRSCGKHGCLFWHSKNIEKPRVSVKSAFQKRKIQGYFIVAKAEYKITMLVLSVQVAEYKITTLVLSVQMAKYKITTLVSSVQMAEYKITMLVLSVQVVKYKVTTLVLSLQMAKYKVTRAVLSLQPYKRNPAGR